MNPTVAKQLDSVPLRSLKANLDSVQKLNPGELLDIARSIVRIEPKQMADTMDVSHSLVLRGLKDGQLNFGRLWELSDAFWLELVLLIIEARKLARVRREIVVDAERMTA